MVAASMFGMETEFGFAATNPAGERVDGHAANALLCSVRRRSAFLSGGDSRHFLPNGGCLYMDGGHVEWATPETTSPYELVMFQRAGELLLANVVDELAELPQFADIRLFKSNVDYINTASSWGCHESYLYTRSGKLISVQLLPFLVSRIIFTGSGGFHVRSPGIDFRLSPRVAHIYRPVSDDSVRDRGIFHTKNETLSKKGYNRLHVICGESNCSQFQTWLKFGTMALVMVALDIGECPGNTLELKDPVYAMNMISADLACKGTVELANGVRLTALEIQRRYLEMVERHVGSAVMPVWADDLCQAWRETLDRLEQNPGSLRTKLDWALKRALFTERIDRCPSVRVESIPVWNDVASRIAIYCEKTSKRRECDDPVRGLSTEYVARHLGGRGALPRELKILGRLLDSNGLEWEQLDHFLALRYELCELDMRFGELGQKGIFESLDKAGVLDHELVSIDSCRRAQTEPPSAGRARIRGEVVARLSKRDAKTPYLCGWTGISGAEGSLDLSDPFEQSETWRKHRRRHSTDNDDDHSQIDFEMPELLRAFLRRQTDRT
jgi:hypothetical protein